MQSARYVGSIDGLKGKTAIIQLVSGSMSRCTAQFDDVELRCPETNVRLGLNWHQFKRRDFEELT